MQPPPDDRDLTARIRAGDRAAFDEVALAHWQPVLGWLWRRLPRAAAEELAQTVFVNAWRAVRSGGQEIADHAAWSRYLLAAARNVLRDHWRRQGREPTMAPLVDDAVDTAAAGQPSGHQPLADDERAALEDCLDRLDPRSRDLCWQHFVDGRSKRDLARSCGRPESSLRMELVRVLDRLRRCLAAKGQAP